MMCRRVLVVVVVAAALFISANTASQPRSTVYTHIVYDLSSARCALSHTDSYPASTTLPNNHDFDKNARVNAAGSPSGHRPARCIHFGHREQGGINGLNSRPRQVLSVDLMSVCPLSFSYNGQSVITT